MNSNRSFNVAVVGATGAVGETMLNILHERDFPVAELVPLDSERSAGTRVKFGDRSFVTQDLDKYDFDGIDIALFSAGGSVSAVHAPRAAAAGAVVIDNTSQFRYDDDIPLVVSEVNPEQVANRPRGIIANPNCSTMQMLVALAPLHRQYGIERINVATYQSVSGAGRSALEELVEALGVEFANDFAEFDHPARGGTADPLQVAVDVEFGIVDPDRMIEAQRYRQVARAQARHQYDTT